MSAEKFALRTVPLVQLPAWAVTRVREDLSGSDVAWFFGQREADEYVAWKNGEARSGKRKAKLRAGRAVLALLILALIPAMARGDMVGLIWNESPSVTNEAVHRVCGYRVHQGLASGRYDRVVSPRPERALSCAMSVSRQVTNFFAVTAVSYSGEESDFSNEVVVPPLRVSGSNLVVTVVGDGWTLMLTNPVDGPRWWTNATIMKEWR